MQNTLMTLYCHIHTNHRKTHEIYQISAPHSDISAYPERLLTIYLHFNISAYEPLYTAKLV